MEFEEMKKIWDEQNQKTLYAINEEALHRSIHAKKKKASRLTNINDFGLIGISIITAIIYVFVSIINKTPSMYDYLIIFWMVGVAAYVWYERLQRKKKERRFDRSMLGDLDHAIVSVQSEIKRSRGMVWWFLLPLAILVGLNTSVANDTSIWEWLVIGGGFVLSYVLIRWELNRCHIPKKQNLEALRAKLAEDSAEKPDSLA